MKTELIIRVWKDQQFRSQLGAQAPAHPAGRSTPAEQVLKESVMSTSPQSYCSIGSHCQCG